MSRHVRPALGVQIDCAVHATVVLSQALATPELRGSTLHRAPVGQGPPGPDWLAISFGFWSGRALATGTAWAGLCLIHHHHQSYVGRVPAPGRRVAVQGGGSPFFFWWNLTHGHAARGTGSPVVRGSESPAV